MSTLFECSLLSNTTDSENNRLLEFFQAVNSISPMLSNSNNNRCIGNIHIDKNGISFIYNNTLDSIKIDVFISDLMFNTFKYEKILSNGGGNENFTSIYINYNTLIYALQNLTALSSTFNNYDLTEENYNESEILIHYSEEGYDRASNSILKQENHKLLGLEDDNKSGENYDKINESIVSFNIILQDAFIKELISLKTFTKPVDSNTAINATDFNNLKFDCILKSKTLLTTLNNLKPFQQHLKNIVLWFKHITLKPKFKNRDFFTNGKVSNNDIKIPNLIFFNINDEIGNIKISILNDINKRRFKKQKKKTSDEDFAIENNDNIELLKFNLLENASEQKEEQEEAILLVDFKKILKIIPFLKISDKVLIQSDINGTLFIQALVGNGNTKNVERDRISIEITIPTKDIEVEENLTIENLKNIITDHDPVSRNKNVNTNKTAENVNKNQDLDTSILHHTEKLTNQGSPQAVNTYNASQTQERKDKKKTKRFF